MSRIFVVEKTYRDLVWASDEDEAYEIFNRHASQMEYADSDAQEIRGAKALERLGFDEDTGPWGAPDDTTVEMLWERANADAWAKRVPVYVVDEDDVGGDLRELVPGFKLDISIGSCVVGHVVYQLPDGTFRLESGAQRDARTESDLDVRRQIEMAKLTDLQKRMARQMEVVNGLL